MTCAVHAACGREFRLNRLQRDAALNRAFQLDRNSPRADIPNRYPFRWEVRKSNLIVQHESDVEQHWFLFDEEGKGGVPGVGVHVIVFLVQGDRLVYSVDTRKHDLAITVFKTELLRVPGKYTILLDDLAQDRELMRAAQDENDLPESWKPKPPRRDTGISEVA